MIRYLRSTVAIRYTDDGGKRRTIDMSRGNVLVVVIGIMVVGAFVIRDVIVGGQDMGWW